MNLNLKLKTKRKQVGEKQNRASKSCGGQYRFNTRVIKFMALDEITGGLVYSEMRSVDLTRALRHLLDFGKIEEGWSVKLRGKSRERILEVKNEVMVNCIMCCQVK